MLSQLNIVGIRVTNDWIKIRQILEEEKIRRNYISIDEYFKICEQNNISDENQKLALSDYLHRLGVILHFQNESDLYNTLILNPSWAVDGTYAVLSNKELAQLGGRFNQERIFSILASKGYKFHEKNILLNLMKKDIFEICYPLPYNDEFIAPQLLPRTRPHYDWNNKNNLQLQFRYLFMPKGILSRLIVRLSGYILVDENKKDLVWAKGALFQEGKAIAEVTEDISKTGEQIIRIRVCSTDPHTKITPDKKSLLMLIRKELLVIHSHSFGNIQFDQMIPCNCPDCTQNSEPALFSFGDLERFLGLGKYIQCRFTGNDVNPMSLIDDIIGFEKYIEEQSQKGKKVDIKYEVHGDLITGDKKMTENKISINKSTIHGNIAAAESIKDSFNTIKNSNASDDLKDTLTQLTKAVEALAKELPKEQAEEVAEDMKVLAEQATKEKPNPKWYNVSIEGLTKAAQNLGKVGDAVIELSGKVRKILTGG